MAAANLVTPKKTPMTLIKDEPLDSMDEQQVPEQYHHQRNEGINQQKRNFAGVLAGKNLGFFAPCSFPVCVCFDSSKLYCFGQVQTCLCYVWK
jgi:hypothetical protein